ncbi:hypothetical protein DLAC_09555 [Tieghemostelium lacteum]|uniref:t-SNARE coiled-coil homology domain-containing protein n=1 Tax=Tieghemostelium lacteum TaxID=361077 RepID=A0A151Z6N6_TIELA|nr:hypothetical protein DLAC_09555 [Tieghemostelium lacteum]|eukprot:KYQ89598.1 hypothetical protein DLAC_09555 [Tieghemostelium lacteum]
MSSTFDQLQQYLNNLNSITQSLQKKKSQVANPDTDNLEFRNQIHIQIENGRNNLTECKKLLSGTFERSDKPKLTKINGSMKQLSSEFEKECTEITNLLMANAIGTSGRSRELSLNNRHKNGHLSARIQVLDNQSAVVLNQSNNNQKYNNQIELNQLEITLSDAQAVEDLIIAEHNEEVKKLANDLLAVREIQKDLNQIVVDQGRDIEDVNTKIAISEDDVQKGYNDTVTSSKYAWSYRKKVIVLTILILIIIALVIAIAVPLAKKK